MAEQRLRVDQLRGIHRLTMSHGANALDGALVDDLRTAIARLADRGDEPLLIASAHARLFSPGWDLKQLAHADHGRVQSFLTRFNRLILELFSYPGPTAAVINGHAVAGGCLLAMACDLRVMASGGARIGLAELNLGVPVPASCIRMLRARLGPAVVEELVFAGDGCTADRARELGMVQRVATADALERVAEQAISSLAAKPRSAVVKSKRFLYETVWQSMRDAAPAEDQAFLDSWFEADTQQRITDTARRLST